MNFRPPRPEVSITQLPILIPFLPPIRGDFTGTYRDRPLALCPHSNFIHGARNTFRLTLLLRFTAVEE